MDTAGSFFCEEPFECLICTDLYINPVTLPCGHNFCYACISRHWSDKELRWCPLCKQEFNKSLKLCVNFVFRDIVDNYKKALRDSEKPTSPDDVLCDCCLHTRRRASKTCLVCLTSYCKTHLEPHLRVTTLKTHTLTDPVPKLEEKMCTKHNRIFEEVNDQPPVCVLCANMETQTLMEKKCEDIKALLEKQDVHNMEPNNTKTEHSNTAPEKMTEDEESESFGDVNICIEDQLFTFSPMPLHRGFSRGRVYYDVRIKTDSGWEVGVVSSKMHRKGFFSLNTNGRWILRLDNHVKCTAGCPLDGIKIPDRVLVCVDYEQRLMFLCHPFNQIILFSFVNCNFKGKLFLFSRQSPEGASVKGFTPKMSSFLSTLFICIALMSLHFILKNVFPDY